MHPLRSESTGAGPSGTVSTVFPSGPASGIENTIKLFDPSASGSCAGADQEESGGPLARSGPEWNMAPAHSPLPYPEGIYEQRGNASGAAGSLTRMGGLPVSHYECLSIDADELESHALSLVADLLRIESNGLFGQPS